LPAILLLRRSPRAKGGIDIPAREITARRVFFTGAHQRANKQDGADGAAVALQQVTIFRQPGRRRVPAQVCERFQPELKIVRAESVRQQQSDRFDIAFLDLTAAQGWRGRSHYVDRGNA
jgi:hypothetical protein